MDCLKNIELKTIELKFLRKLLDRGGRSEIVHLSPNEKTPAAKRDRICKKLASQGLVNYRQRRGEVHYLARWSNVADARYDEFAGDA